MRYSLEDFKVIAFTHKNLPLELVGKLHLSPDEQIGVLGAFKLNFGITELLFLSTCNRVEIFLLSEQDLDSHQLSEMCRFINSRLSSEEVTLLSLSAQVYQGHEAVKHVLRVASSLDSLVVGEREIITQVRKAYDHCNMLGLTGDFIRLLIRQTIETAKEIYTHTDIARNPVSVVSLAYRQLKNAGIKSDARFVFVGSGETNTTMAKYLQKHKFANFTVFNRTLANAEKLAQSLGGSAYPIEELSNYKSGFDVLIVCTSSSLPVITSDIYTQLTSGDTGKKVVIDLGIPANVDIENIAANHKVNYIDVNSLKEQAEANLKLRENEVGKCEEIIQQKTDQFEHLHKERSIELAFGEIPKQVKAIRELAWNEVFAKDIDQLDDNSKQVLEKVLAYVEKKYNAVTIKTAKNVLLNQRD